MPASLPENIEHTIRRDNPKATGAWGGVAVGAESCADRATRAPVVGGGFAAPPVTPPPVGSLLPLLPGFKLTHELARGGMGVVFAARDEVLERDVAIKTLLPGTLANPTAARRFVIEARITARLTHPGIPPVYALGALPDGRPFLAMKLIKGRTLAAVLAARAARITAPDDGLERTALYAPGLLHVFEQICQAVGYAHNQGVIHRDLKPANVMLGAFGEVQVMDWGLARELERGCGTGTHAPLTAPDSPQTGSEDTGIRAADETDRSRLGEALGTPAFMPPEQARGDWDRVDARADVFALGGILCTILTGQPPYTGRSVVEVVRRAIDADLDEAIKRLDACGNDPVLIALAKRCLASAPEDRLPNGAAVAVALQSHALDLEERVRAEAGVRVTMAVRLAERRARAIAVAAERKAAAEHAIRATNEAEAERIATVRRHWIWTALITLVLLVLALVYHIHRAPSRSTTVGEITPVPTVTPSAAPARCH